MKNKLYILIFSLLYTVQIALCMDEQKIVPKQGDIYFSNSFGAKYFSESLRKQSEIHLGITIEKETPCLWATFFIKKDGSSFNETAFEGPIPLNLIVTKTDKIILPKVHLEHGRSELELISIVRKAEVLFRKSKDLFAFHPNEILSVVTKYYEPDRQVVNTSLTFQQMKKEIQYYIDKGIVIEHSMKIIDTGVRFIKYLTTNEGLIEHSTANIGKLVLCHEHGPCGFDTSLRDKKEVARYNNEDIANLLTDFLKNI